MKPKADNIKAVIFDMDGIIIDSEPWQTRAFLQTVKPFDITFTDDEMNKFIGVRDMDTFAWVIDKYNPGITVQEMKVIKDENYHKLLRENIEPRQHLMELLNYFKDKYKLAVGSCSAKLDIEMVLEMLKIRNYFSACVSGDDVEASKPDQEIFLKTAKALGIAPENCAVLEDSHVGAEAAQRAGMLSIAVPTDTTRLYDFSHADYIYEDLKKVQEIL